MSDASGLNDMQQLQGVMFHDPDDDALSHWHAALAEEEEAAEKERRRAASGHAATEGAPARPATAEGNLEAIAPLATTLHSYWNDVDPASPETRRLCSLLAECSISKNGMLLMTTAAGSTFCAMYIPQQNGHPVEFIGKTNGMTRFGKIPLNDDEAQAIVAAAAARGWKAISLTGSTADKDKLFLAAVEAGLDVKGYKPSLEIQSRFSSPETGVAGEDSQFTQKPKAGPAASQNAQKPKAATAAPVPKGIHV